MEKEESSKTPGPSGLIGKGVKIELATEADVAFIKEELKKNNMDTDHVDYHEFVVASEGDDRVGFGRLRETGKAYQIGCVVVVGDKRRHGIGSLIVKHLIDTSRVNLVYIPIDLADYFKKLGFAEMKESSRELLDAFDKACGVRGKPNTVVMVYEGPKP
ncbi:MAG: GNAT family N-acetyltransferase [Thermodesulfovibrionales bacterium]|jgi:N-acetylglutamate synthase-like GNAT family acetyltransferase